MCLLYSPHAEIHSEATVPAYAEFVAELEKSGHELAEGGIGGPTRWKERCDMRSHVDYSEEAIPERDPSYRPVDASLYDSPTTEVLSAAARRALARCLEQLGMSPVRAALVASL